MNEKEMAALIKRCWNAASSADMLGAAPMLMGQDQFGAPLYNNIRLQTYYLLIGGNMAPRKMTVNHETPKEPWQE